MTLSAAQRAANYDALRPVCHAIEDLIDHGCLEFDPDTNTIVLDATRYVAVIRAFNAWRTLIEAGLPAAWVVAPVENSPAPTSPTP